METLLTKKCCSCGEEKPLSDFPNRKSSKDGKASKCKQCTKEYVASQYLKHRDARLKKANEYYKSNKDDILDKSKQYYLSNIEDIKKKKSEFYDLNVERLLAEKQKYYSENAETICENRRLAYQDDAEKFIGRARQYRSEHPETYKASREKYAQANPKKRKVLSQVAYAIKIGLLVRQVCEVCGDHNSQGHHLDYDKPYEVLWLCQKHHSEWHRVNGEGLNGV